VASRQGNQPWKQWHAVDLVRAGSQGKPFWHAEAQAGPLWMQPQVIEREREDGRIPEPEDIRLWNMISFAGGATGLLYPRWRPLLDGPLFGAFGAYGMDGSRTPRSAMVSRLARWAASSEQADVWAARPVRGEIGIVVVPDAQLFCYAQQGSTDFFAQSLRGTYQGFFENNIQADWVLPEQIDAYDVLYLPYPAMLPSAVAARLRAWVEQGGTLISEGCPGYFGDGGRVGTVQPNHDLDKLFGAREEHVEFTPDILGNLTFELAGRQVPGGLFLQTYAPTTGTAAGRFSREAGRYAEGGIAVVDHQYGQGRTRLIGTFPGYGHFHRPSTDSRAFFADLAHWAGIKPHASVDAPGVVARLHASPTSTFLWVLNHCREASRVSVDLGEPWGPFREARARWGDDASSLDERRVSVQVDARDAVILEMH
jgi:beta-galactosidase